jgi:hypothetical protein
MNKVIGFVLLTAALGGCTIAQRTEDGLQPSALIGTQTARCERDARVGSAGVGPSFPTPGTTPRGDSDVTRDINRTVYYSCANKMQ